METKCVGDNINMFLTVMAILVTNSHYLFTSASGTNIQNVGVINIHKPSPTLSHQDDDVNNITLTKITIELIMSFIFRIKSILIKFVTNMVAAYMLVGLSAALNS